MSLPKEMVVPLQAAGLISGEAVVTALAGGVSCDIWKVESGGRVFAVKRALPKLRVAAEWLADVSRNHYEQEYIRYVAGFLPDCVPRILYSSPDSDFFAMEFLGGEFSDWKQALLAGRASPETARRAGSILGTIHSRSWLDEDLARRFDTVKNFYDLRLSSYLLTTADKHPRVGRTIRDEAERLAGTKLALVHGDYSPKNLMVAPGRLVVLDCEVAWFGDPAFDLAFLLNHLLLKGLYHAPEAAPFHALVSAARAAYREANPAHASQVETSTARLLPMLSLARVDGKSPAEYLVDEKKRCFIREFAPDAIASELSLDDVVLRWFQTLTSFHAA